VIEISTRKIIKLTLESLSNGWMRIGCGKCMDHEKSRHERYAAAMSQIMQLLTGRTR